METLKRKKMYEKQRDQVAGQQFNIDQTAFAIDSIKDTQTTVAAMKAAGSQLKTEVSARFYSFSTTDSGRVLLTPQFPGRAPLTDEKNQHRRGGGPYLRHGRHDGGHGRDQ